MTPISSTIKGEPRFIAQYLRPIVGKRVVRDSLGCSFHTAVEAAIAYAAYVHSIGGAPAVASTSSLPAAAQSAACAAAHGPLDAHGPLAEGSVYRVECLLADRHVDTGREFLVRWEGYGKEADTWENERNLIDKALVRHFDTTRRRAEESDAADDLWAQCDVW